MRIQAAKITKISEKTIKKSEKSNFQGKKICYFVFFAYLRAMFRAKKSHNFHFLRSLPALVAAGLVGCASMGSPGGGLYDETPPVLRQSTPAEGATNVTKSKITMRFDENIKLDKATEKLTVSPPQEKAPMILSNAKTLTIELFDTLKPNTTYSIDLADAVQDNNEGNPMESLSLLFSTGDHIDSLQISGHMLNAEDLEPVTGAYVGIYKMREADGSPVMINDSTSAESLGDSILQKFQFEKVGKTDALGAFRILGIAPGTYKIYGLIDGNTNYKFDLNTENIAFHDSLIVPGMDNRQRYDTVWADTATIDTIMVKGYIDYWPKDLILYSFNEGKQTRYLDNCSRPDSIHINIRFAARMDSLPTLAFMLPDSTLISADSLLIAEPNPTMDTLSYWIKDSIWYSVDTLQLQLTYAFTDTTGFDILRSDTIALVKPEVKPASNDDENGDKKKKKGKRKKKDDDAEADSTAVAAPVITYMTIKQIAGQNLNIGQKPRFEVSAPLDSCNLDGIHLERQQDTLWIEMPIEWVADSLHPRRYTLLADPHYSPGESYRLTIDSAAMHDIYMQPVNKATMTFKEKNQEDYAHLLFNIEGISGPAFVQLVDAKDKPIQQIPVIDKQAKFVHVPAGTYYARLVLDTNNNGRFDTGNLYDRIHPESVFYFNAELQLRANWSVSQTWNPTLTPILEQKLEAVKQNKPKEQKEKKSKNEEYLRKLGKL